MSTAKWPNIAGSKKFFIDGPHCTDGRSLGNSGEEKQRSQNVYLCNARVFLHPFLLTKQTEASKSQKSDPMFSTKTIIMPFQNLFRYFSL